MIADVGSYWVVEMEAVEVARFLHGPSRHLELRIPLWEDGSFSLVDEDEE